MERARKARGGFTPAMEPLEPRRLLAVVTIDLGSTLRAVNPHVAATNLAWWGGDLGDAQTRQMTTAAGLTLYRFPGGSSSDDNLHFTTPAQWNGYDTAPMFAKFVEAQGAAGMATVDYGSGSPQEAAAYLAYLNGSASNATAIGNGQMWNATTSAWVPKDWKTAGYWAALRGAAPLGTDDGLNFLRLGHAAPFTIHYWEVGNEEYGSWEVDHHGSGGDAGHPHDPATYVAFAKAFATLAASIDATISIGVDTGSINYDNSWTANVLQQGVTQGFTPGFLSDHVYMQAPGSESDATLLLHTVSDPNNQDPNNPYYWPLRASGYRSLLQQKLGTSAAANVELLCTEFNSVYANPGKQSTSLVNGLFVADSIGSLMQTEYNAAVFWDLRNGWSTGNNNSASLYGWRQGGDYGLLGDAAGPAPSTGQYVPYPNYFAEQLISKFAQAGGTVVRATSGDANLSAYAVREPNGHLALLVINKSPTADLAETIQLKGGVPASSGAAVWQYGKAQDTAQGQTTDGHAALASSTPGLTVTGSSFAYTFPSYSMTLIDLPVTPPAVVGRFVFYNNSNYDGGSTATGLADDGAIATDKSALLPGQTSGFANFTAYSRGINGVMVDVAGFENSAALAAADFAFVAGNTGTPGSWLAAPGPAITVRPGGVNGSDRVELTWADGAIQNQWLRVTVKATANTGLAAADVFYFGNLIGDASGNGQVTATDVALAKAANGTAATPTTPTDFNRSGQVNATDVAIAKANNAASLVALSGSATSAAMAQAPTAASPAAATLAPAPSVQLDDDAAPGRGQTVKRWLGSWVAVLLG